MKKLIILFFLLAPLTLQASEDPLDEMREMIESGKTPEEKALEKEYEENKDLFILSEEGFCEAWQAYSPKSIAKFKTLKECQKSPLSAQARMDFKLKQVQERKDYEEKAKKEALIRKQRNNRFDAWAKTKPKAYSRFKIAALNQSVQAEMPEDLVYLILGKPLRQSVSKGVKQLIYPQQQEGGEEFQYIYIISGKVDSYQ